MFTIIGGDGKEYGPVTVEQLRSWIAGGRANLETKAKAAGSDEWRRLGDFAEFASTGQPPPISPAAASYPTSYALPGSPQPGTAPAAEVPLTGTPAEIAATLNARADDLDVFDCLSRAFELWKNNFLPLVGVTLLVVIAQMAVGFIPVLGTFAGLFLNGVFYGGLYYYYLGKMRGEHREVGDAFAGFSKAFLPLMLASLITSLVTLGIMMLFCAPWMLMIFKSGFKFSPGSMPPLPTGGMLIGFGVAFFVMMFLSIAWSFTFPLIIDRGLGPWQAMEVSRRVVSRQWFRVFFVAFLGGILAMLGLIGFFIGIFLTMPLVFASVLYAYEAVCNGKKNSSSLTSPPS